MQLSELRGEARRFRPSPADRLLGGLGALAIGLTLFGVRLWARATRTPYLKD